MTGITAPGVSCRYEITLEWTVSADGPRRVARRHYQHGTLRLDPGFSDDAVRDYVAAQIAPPAGDCTGPGAVIAWKLTEAEATP